MKLVLYVHLIKLVGLTHYVTVLLITIYNFKFNETYRPT